MAETIKNAGGELSGTLSGDTPLEKKIKTMEELDEMIAKYQKMAAENKLSQSDKEMVAETLERLINEKESRQQLGQ